MSNPLYKQPHFCPDWDYDLIQGDAPEMDACICDLPTHDEPQWITQEQIDAGKAWADNVRSVIVGKE